ncbi:TRAP transporter small permease [Celerinatantimonas yamalensis]|uniref:TRAP transporter small permease protein n=1 Tax=Celerinatantimonas yamalensis TaxID=559956 RepID=A0ABW9G5Q8_9GAMM
MIGKLRQLELALAKISLAAMALLILIGGIARTLDHPVIWSLEISMVIFAWVSMLAIDQALQKQRHIGIDILTIHLSQRTQRRLNLMNQLIILGFLICGIWYGYSFTITTGNQVLPVTQLPLYILNAAVPTGCVLMAITTIEHIIHSCRIERASESLD